MKISDRPEFQSKPPPLTCGADEAVLVASKRMSERNYGSIIVIDGERQVLGLLTERDILRRLVAVERSPAQTMVSEIMTSDLRIARASDDIIAWLRLMSNERFRRLPVVDEGGRLINVITQGDFVSYTWPDLLIQTRTLVKQTFGGTFSLPILLAGALLYTVAIIFAVALSVR
ncbi:MAG: CBS domain-containing protein [Sphingomicrobium sp.]